MAVTTRKYIILTPRVHTWLNNVKAVRTERRQDQEEGGLVVEGIAGKVVVLFQLYMCVLGMNWRAWNSSVKDTGLPANI